MTDVRASVEALVASGALDLARRTLTLALEAQRPTGEQEVLLQALLRVPREVRVSDGEWAVLTARLLGNTRQPQGVLDFTREVRAHLPGPAAAPVLAFEALALVREGRHEEALGVSAGVLPHVTGLPLGLAWRARAEALAWLGRDGWREAFARAGSLLSGRALGTCRLEEGHLLERRGEDAAAQAAWREALVLLEGDVLYAAWVRHALGLSYLRLGLPEAEEHFLELERLSRRRGAEHMRARAMCGLGAARRARGEWARAQASYTGALRHARDPDDEQQARRGLAHTLRLSGRPGAALEELTRAAHCVPAERDTGRSRVFVDIAATHLTLNQLEPAREALARSGEVQGPDAERAAIVRAELARRAGDPALARRELGRIRLETLWVREEQAQFPELFALLGPARPPPLAREGLLRADVRALGTLRVTVNGRPVPLRATGRPGELLVLLLEHGGRAPSEVLTAALYPDRTGRRAGQALWALARDLRSSLGWQDSLHFQGGAYLLDPAAQWWYDVREALVRREPTPAFLSGVYREWVTDRARELAAREENRDSTFLSS